VGLKNVLYIIVVVLTANFASASYPSPVGLWQFDDPNHLTRAALGQDLVEVGTHSAVAGINAGDGAVADPLGSYYICNHGILPNGDGDFKYVNNWTVMMDVKVPASSIGQWVALYQTDPTNSNDADCFIAPDGTIGVGDTGYTRNKINGDTWYRIVISVDNMNFYRIYVNGHPWKNGTVQPLDGRFSLDPQILFFADDDGEDYLIYCTNLAIWGQALEDSQVAELGDTTAPIVVDAAGAAGSNLLANPSAENDIDSWIIADGNDWQATDRTDWHYPHTGNYYFTAGRSAHAEINQVINLGYMATAIDSGSVIANVRGYLGGNDSDQGRIIVEYLDADDAILATTDSDWVVGPNSVNWTQLVLPDADGFAIPSGTRSAKYRLLAQRTNGTDCHAYFDDLVWEYRLAIPGNNAPGVPSIAGPSSGSIGVDANFTFSAVDPDANQVDYQIDWGDEISDWSDFQDSGSDYIVQHNWPVLGTYSVRARSRDTNGGLSAWSPPFNVTISGDAAGVFKSQPYLQNVSQDAMTIAWETDRIVNPTVDWGLTASYGSQTRGLCIDVGAGAYICKVRISGLDPQTTYHFRANNGSTAGTDATFTTAPYGQPPFRLAVWGDSQQVAKRLNGDPAHPECSTAMFTDMASTADIAVSVGDLVEDATYGYYVSAFRPYVSNILGKQKPFFAAFGNHDVPVPSLVDIHKVIQNSGMHSFSFNYSNAHFTCIDYDDCIKDMFPSDGSISSLPLGWIEQDLSSDDAQNAAWRFFFIHVPPYSERWISGSSIMQTYLVPLLNQYNVQICFSGHVHEYERGMLNGTFYVITGTCSYLDILEKIVTDWPFMTVGGDQNIPGVLDGGGEVHGWTEVQIDGIELHLIQHAYNLDGTSLEGTSFGAGVIDTIDIVQADFNLDKTVDFEDLAILFDSWLSTPQDAAWNPACDMADKAQKIINFKDMAVFAQYWHFNGQF